MPLVGGGGAGYTAGSSPTGTGTGLNYIGDHAYAYSGVVSINNNESTLIRASTQGEYVKGILMPLGLTITTSDYKFQIKINGEIVGQYTLDSGNNRDNFHQLMHLIIPSYSTIEVIANNATNTANLDCAVMITGDLYA